MTDLDSPKRNNDCYFYYYSTCSKGDSCSFRHEPSALGCETVCSFWKEGKCLNVHCNFRHMELRKNRKAIPCYWETQPGGCLKPHCPFMHKNARHPVDNSLMPKPGTMDSPLNENLNQPGSCTRSTPSVDSLVVNFEEESDSESVPTTSPAKIGNQTGGVKTLEEIKLESIQAASAAYYSYTNEHDCNASDLRNRIVERLKTKTQFRQHNHNIKQVLFDDPTRGRKTRNQRTTPEIGENFESITIKTLEEIRAERNARKLPEDPEKVASKRKHSPIRFEGNKIAKTESQNLDEAIVTSTSTDDPVENKVAIEIQKPMRKLNIKKIKHGAADDHISTSNENANVNTEVENKAVSNEEDKTVSSEEDKAQLNEENKISEECGKYEPVETEQVKNIPELQNRTFEESMLLDDPEDNINIQLKGEDELLNEIDDLLND